MPDQFDPYLGYQIGNSGIEPVPPERAVASASSPLDLGAVREKFATGQDIAHEPFAAYETLYDLMLELEQAYDELAQARADIERLRAALDRDKTGLAGALAEVVKAARGRMWILDGRGIYEWDDDEYRKEAGYALHEIIEIGTKALANSGTLANEELRTWLRTER